MIYKVFTEKEEVMKKHNRNKLGLPSNQFLLFDQEPSIPSGSTMQSIANTNPEAIDVYKLKNIRNQQNIVQLYKDFFNESISNAVQKYNDDIISGKIPTHKDSNGNLELDKTEDALNLNTIIHAMYVDRANLANAGYTSSQIDDIIENGYIPESVNEKECKIAIDLILQNSRLLVRFLTNMIKNNYTALNISVHEANSIISDLNNDKTTHLAMAKIKEILDDPSILKKYKFGQCSYDFRPINGACMFLSKTPSIQVSQKPSKKLNLIFNYDAVVIAHGSEADVSISDVDESINSAMENTVKSIEQVLPLLNNIKNDEYDIKKVWRSIHSSLKKCMHSKDIDEIKKALVNANTEIRGIENFKALDLGSDRNNNDWNKKHPEATKQISRTLNLIKTKEDPSSIKKNGKSVNWIMEPVSTLKHSNITSVVELLRALKKEGFKNVYIGACNPGGVKIPQDLKDDKNFKYVIANSSTYLECDIYDDEQKIISIYNELQTLYNEINLELLTEGRFTEFIKNSIKKVGELVKKLWNKLIEFFNKIIRSISEKIGTLLHIPNSKTKFKEPIEVSFIGFSGKSANTEKKKCYSTDDIKRSVDEANKSINDAIKIHQQKVNQAIKNAEQRLKQVGLKESGIFNDIAFI